MTNMPLMRTRLLLVARAGLRFDGVDDYAEIPHSESLNLNVLTVAAWMKSTFSGAWFRTIVAKYGYTYIDESWGLGWVDTNVLGFYVRDPAGVRNTASAGSGEGLDGSWHFLVGVASDSQVQFWMDGVLKSAVSRTAGDIRNTRPVTIARHLDTYVPVAVGGVLIYSRALTSDEILWNFYYPDNPVRSGLVLWLHWDSIDTASNMWRDKSGFGNHAVLYNNPAIENVAKAPSRLLTPTRILTPVR